MVKRQLAGSQTRVNVAVEASGAPRGHGKVPVWLGLGGSHQGWQRYKVITNGSKAFGVQCRVFAAVQCLFAVVQGLRRSTASACCATRSLLWYSVCLLRYKVFAAVRCLLAAVQGLCEQCLAAAHGGLFGCGVCVAVQSRLRNSWGTPGAFAPDCTTACTAYTAGAAHWVRCTVPTPARSLLISCMCAHLSPCPVRAPDS